MTPPLPHVLSRACSGCSRMLPCRLLALSSREHTDAHVRARARTRTHVFAHKTVWWSHGAPDWMRSLDQTHATIPAARAYLRVIGRKRNTWHSDTDLALMLQRCRKKGICVLHSLVKKKKNSQPFHTLYSLENMIYIHKNGASEMSIYTDGALFTPPQPNRCRRIRNKKKHDQKQLK